ncbi:MAG: diaminopimelate epimerase [Candidatus Glassbacteria bacterium]
MIEFVKMQGAGNDYIFIDCLDSQPPSNPAELSRRMSDRHFGIGGDGLILLLPPTGRSAHCRMRMFNADGSESEMCGNGIRCLAKLAWESGRKRVNPLIVETGAGLLTLELLVENGWVRSVTVDMGLPRFSPQEVGVKLQGGRIVDQPITALDRTFTMTCVSMGNPHAVIFLEEPVERFAVERYGPALENDPLFANRTNVEFVNVQGKNLLRQRTWERGSGETLACGTGASAVAVAGITTGRCSPGRVEVVLNGGSLSIAWREGENVMMTGPAEEVFRGQWPE